MGLDGSDQIRKTVDGADILIISFRIFRSRKYTAYGIIFKI